MQLWSQAQRHPAVGIKVGHSFQKLNNLIRKVCVRVRVRVRIRVWVWVRVWMRAWVEVEKEEEVRMQD